MVAGDATKQSHAKISAIDTAGEQEGENREVEVAIVVVLAVEVILVVVVVIKQPRKRKKMSIRGENVGFPCYAC